eukprot:4799798-Alexandrium_andersonii.AAC.1
MIEGACRSRASKAPSNADQAHDDGCRHARRHRAVEATAEPAQATCISAVATDVVQALQQPRVCWELGPRSILPASATPSSVRVRCQPKGTTHPTNTWSTQSWECVAGQMAWRVSS